MNSVFVMTFGGFFVFMTLVFAGAVYAQKVRTKDSLNKHQVTNN